MGIIGSIIGDIAGSRFETNPACSKFGDLYPLFEKGCYFTDDTVMSIATLEALHGIKDFEEKYVEFGKKYPDAGYGSSFRGWIFADEPIFDEDIEKMLHPEGRTYMRKPYNSFGNGSAMRAGVIGQYYRHMPFRHKVISMAEKSAWVTHNHPEGIKGAVTIAVCVWMAERKYNKEEILQYAVKQYPYPEYDYGCNREFDTCQ